MPITKEKKGLIIRELEEGIKNSNIAVFLNFHGTGVSKINVLRKKIRELNSFYKVAKKTFIKKVLVGFQFEGDEPELKGEVAVAFGNDEIGLSKAISSFIKENIKKNAANLNVFEILGGILENRFINAKAVLDLSRIPGREILLAKLAASLNACPRRLVGALGASARNFVCVLNQIKENKK